MRECLIVCVCVCVCVCRFSQFQNIFLWRLKGKVNLKTGFCTTHFLRNRKIKDLKVFSCIKMYTHSLRSRDVKFVLLIIAQYFHKTVYIFLMFYYELSVFC